MDGGALRQGGRRGRLQEGELAQWLEVPEREGPAGPPPPREERRGARLALDEAGVSPLAGS